MDDTLAKPRKGKRLEGRVRRSFELFFLGLGLLLGLGVVGGCGVLGVAAVADDMKALTAVLLIVAITMLIGVVYLATSMSRDVRILKEKLLEKEK